MMLEDVDEYWRRVFTFSPFTVWFNITGQPAIMLPLKQARYRRDAARPAARDSARGPVRRRGDALPPVGAARGRAPLVRPEAGPGGLSSARGRRGRGRTTPARDREAPGLRAPQQERGGDARRPERDVEQAREPVGEHGGRHQGTDEAGAHARRR